MRSPREIIIRPVVSEKSYSGIDQSVYTFIVHPDAKKTEIRQAVESIWGVSVVQVNTLTRKGKPKRHRFVTGRTPTIKKAIVRLAEGDKIELFETR